MKTQMHFGRRAVPDLIVVGKAAGDAKSRQTHTFIFSESFPRDNQGSLANFLKMDPYTGETIANFG